MEGNELTTTPHLVLAVYPPPLLKIDCLQR